jgi:hypothetical protein
MSTTSETPTKPPDGERVVAAANERLQDWNLRCGTWYVYHYTAGILGVVLNLIIASFAKLKADELNWLFWLALAAATLQGVTTFVAAKRKAAAYRSGWRVLWLAKQRFETRVDPDPKRVLDAINEGWRRINEGDRE